MAAIKGKKFEMPKLEPAGTKFAYNAVTARIKSASKDSIENAESLIIDLLHEKS
jgi:hypothetical protein